MNLGCGTGHPSYVMSSSFANQTIAQIELFTQTAKYHSGSMCCRSIRREGGAAAVEEAQRHAHRATDTQAKYIGVAKSGPYKTDHYRY